MGRAAGILLGKQILLVFLNVVPAFIASKSIEALIKNEASWDHCRSSEVES